MLFQSTIYLLGNLQFRHIAQVPEKYFMPMKADARRLKLINKAVSNL